MSGRGRFNTRSSAQNQNYNQNAKTSYNTRNSYTPTYSTPTGYQQQKEPQQPAVQPPVAPQGTPQRPPAQQAQTPAYQTQQYQQPQQQPVQQKVEQAVDITPKVAPPVAQPKPENPGQPEDVKMDEVEGGEEGKRKGRKWARRTPDYKIPRRIRKRRQNARLKNLLAPKNAMMVLHELHPELKMSIIEQPNVHNQTAYTVEIELDGKVFQGMGMSKMAAKQAGSEAALKAVLLKKLEENNVKLAQQSAANKTEGGFDEDISMADVSAMKEGDDDQSSQNGGPKSGKHLIPEDDVPWGSLASFALYKLFSEWQSQGFQLPAASGLQNVCPPNKPLTPVAGTPAVKKIPDDANQKHPVQLLNQLRPGSQYVETREGMPPNLTFTYTVKVDELTFKGVGNSKKDAKKLCAKHALEHLGVIYND